jgi:hypothetical protein
MIEAAAKMLAHQFFTTLDKEVSGGDAEPVDL